MARNDTRAFAVSWTRRLSPRECATIRYALALLENHIIDDDIDEEIRPTTFGEPLLDDAAIAALVGELEEADAVMVLR